MLTSKGYYDDKLSFDDAVAYLRKRLREFPFADWDKTDAVWWRSRSQAVQITAMMSQFAAGLIPREALRLGFIYNSNTHRSGKTLLAKMAIIPPNGRMASQPWSTKDEELKKVLDAEVLRASRYIIFDNVRGHVSSQVLENFMTSSVHTGRILGKTQMFEAANTATVFITGNDITVSADMKQRTLLVDLFVPEANVQERQVEKPIDDAWLMAIDNRMKILSALWAIVREWAEQGRPLAKENLRVGYERWCEVFAGLTVFAGFGDPLATPSDIETDVDTEGADMRALVKILARPLIEGDQRRRECHFQEVVNIVHEAGLFDWVLDGKEIETDVGGGIRRTDFVLKPDANSKFGKLLKRYAPHVGDAQGPRFRMFRLMTNKGAQVVHMSCTGKNRQRRYIVELPV